MGNGDVIARSFDFVAAKLVIFESAKGPVPNLADWIAGERITGSWWSHPLSEEIFLATRAIRVQHEEVLVCRLVIGKITYVHRDLWAALYRLRHKIEAEPMAQILEAHDERGRHVTTTKNFSDFVPESLRFPEAALPESEAMTTLEPFESLIPWKNE